ncbi:cytochrome P450 [Lactarius pseudohatsudake]|nr:cytochrome P450 [Lactarius pseudohatsudake]KAH9018422.1 cytochrome P450 [Lactarius pseudohatsudake]
MEAVKGCQGLVWTSPWTLTAFDSFKFHFYRRTSAVMAWWALAMLAYPEIQARAQAELDATTYTSPYIRATVKEALRLRAVDPAGLPHRSLEDDWHNLHRQRLAPEPRPDIYGEDAAHFNPARHLYANGEIAPGPPDAKEEGHFAYGFGRRSCVGRHVANNSLFINIPVALGAQSRANEGPHRPISSLEWMWTARWKLVLSSPSPLAHEIELHGDALLEDPAIQAPNLR